MSLSLEPLFSPKSVAIIGASSIPGRSGYTFTTELIDSGYSGKCYPINPKGGNIKGLTIFKSLKVIDEEIDLALILVNRNLVKQAVIDCAEHGVKVGVIYAAGFGELGEDGENIQQDLVAIARSKGMRLVGPNCMGVFSSPSGLNLTGEPIIPSGPIGLVSQSGGIGFSAWYDAANYLKTGFSRFIGFGNQADVPVHEYLEYVGQDPETKVIVLYLEGILPGMGASFIEVAKKITPHKPIVAIKGGSTSAGTRAAASHTGSLAGVADIYSAAFRQAGIIEVERLDELLPVAQTLLECPTFEGDKLALIGAGGGHMIVGADAAERNGFKIPAFNDNTESLIAEKLYHFAPRKNPVDLAGSYVEDLRVWPDVTRLALNEKGIGGVLLYGAYGSYFPDLNTNGETWESTSVRLGEVQKETGKPIVSYSVAGRSDLPCNHALRNSGIPLFDSIEVATRCLRALQEYGQIRGRAIENISLKPNKQIDYPVKALDKAAIRQNRNLTEPEAYSLLNHYSVPVAPYQLAKTANDAIMSAETIGYPVVLKICSPDVVHKSDVGGVELNISTANEVEEAFNDIISKTKDEVPGVDIEGTIVSKQISGVEVIAGVFRDEQFGPVLMVGLGGIFVETLKDVSFRVLPASPTDLHEMLKELKGYPLLTGVRGKDPVNIDALLTLLTRFSELVLAHPNIAEVDLNPIFVDKDTATVADARIVVSPVSKETEVLS